MSSKLAALLTFAAVLGVQTRSAEAQRPGGNTRPQFSVVTSGDNSILVDQREGRTWLLTHSPAGGAPAWVPIQRIDSPEEAEHWREEQHALAEQREREHREHHEREMRERLEDRRREMMQRREEFEERARREHDKRMHDERMRDERERDQRERDDQERRQREQRERSERPDSERPEKEPAPPAAPASRERLKQLGEDTQRRILDSLQQHRQRLIEQFSTEHPAVKSISEQIERLSRELKQRTDDVEPPAKKRDDAKSDAAIEEPQQRPLKEADPRSADDNAPSFASAIRKAFFHLLEELKTLENTGAGESRVMELRDKIEVLQRLLKQIDENERGAGLPPKKGQAPEPDEKAGTDKEAKSDAKAKDEKGPAQNANIDDIAADFRGLRAQEQLLLQTIGPDHPKVRQIRKKIELTEKFLNEFKVQPRNANPADETNRSPDRGEKPHGEIPTDSKDKSDAATSQHPQGALVSDIRLEIESMKPLLKKFPSVADELFPLLLRHMKLVEEYGPEHPDVKEIQNQLERLRRLYPEADIETVPDSREPAEAR